MTNINDIADFVNIIRNDPQWADVVRGILLGQELLALPAQFAEFVQLTQETNRLTNERLTGVEGRLTGVEGRLTGVEGRLTGVEGQMTGVEERLTRVENQTANLVGSDIERRVHGNVINLTGRRLGLRRAQVLRSNIMSIDPELQQAIEEAEDQGLITGNQAEQVENTDIIIRGFSPVEGSDVHPAIEVSRTIHDDDITRARERADNLAKIMGTSPLAIAVVIGGRIEPPQQELADGLAVSTIIQPELAV